MHIHGQTLDDFRSGRLTPGQDAAVHRHITICLACAEAVAAEAMSSTRWERRGLLGRLVRIDAAPAATAAEAAERDDAPARQVA